MAEYGDYAGYGGGYEGYGGNPTGGYGGMGGDSHGNMNAAGGGFTSPNNGFLNSQATPAGGTSGRKVFVLTKNSCSICMSFVD